MNHVCYRRVAACALLLVGFSAAASAQPNPDLLWTNSAITNWITVVNKNTGALVKELDRAGKGNGIGIAVVGNTVFYTVRMDKNVYKLDKNTGAELGIAFSIPPAIELSAITYDGRNFWVRDYESSPRAYYVTPSGVILKTITLANCGYQCDTLEYVNGNLIANRLFETTPNYYDLYSTSGAVLQAPFLYTTAHPGRSLAYDGTSYYVSDSNNIHVYNATGVLTRSMSPGGKYVNYRDLSFEYAPALAATSVTRGDFDGDGKTDVATYAQANGYWHVLSSASGYTTDTAYPWGMAGDVPVPGDYDGDGRGDVAVFRPSTGRWFVLRSGGNYTTYGAYIWGASTDVPVPADYDGDGRTDIAIYRPSTGAWWALLSGSNFTTSLTRTFGTVGDVPAARDYDGDLKADFAVFRPSNGNWYALQSSTNYATYSTRQWGGAGDVPVPADYDGDGKTDYAIYRPSNGFWWTLLSSTNYANYVSRQWGGVAGDVPVQADYDGDAKADVAIYRPDSGLWHVIHSATGTAAAY